VNGEPNRIIQEKGGRTMLIGLILTSVVLAGFAQITLKTGVNHVTGTSGGELHLSAGSLRSLLSSPVVWGGLVLFGLSAIVWLFALSRASLSFAYPFAALTYVVVVMFDAFRGEPIGTLRWSGAALIVAGIILVSRTSPHGG